jgi:hypothetical protein
MQTGHNQWRARCPAHDGRSRTLSVRETDDGRTLLHCFASCAPLEVLGAVGLRMADLFPRKIADHRFRSSRSLMSATEALACIDHEVIVVEIILSEVIATRTFNEDQLQRLMLAVQRISSARSLTNPARLVKGEHLVHA